MGDLATTLALARGLGVDAPAERVERLYSFFIPELTEWSINRHDDVRGGLRVSVWTHDIEAVERALGDMTGARGPGSVAALCSQVPWSDMDGVGLALGVSREPRLRWWRLAGEQGGAALADAVVAAWPALTDDLADAHALLCDVCGAPRRCKAVGAESTVDGELVRASVYFELLHPGAAVRVLEHLGVHSTLPGNLFFKGLLGLGDEDPRPWPKVWVGRSVGAAGSGWKFYYFARGDARRPTDEVLLDVASTQPGAQQGYDIAREQLGAAGPLVQLMGLTFPDAAPPDREPIWTVYLAAR